MLLVCHVDEGYHTEFLLHPRWDVSIHQLWLHRKRLKPSLKKAMKREAGEIIESYPGGYLSVVSTDWLLSSFFFPFETDLSE